MERKTPLIKNILVVNMERQHWTFDDQLITFRTLGVKAWMKNRYGSTFLETSRSRKRY